MSKTAVTTARIEPEKATTAQIFAQPNATTKAALAEAQQRQNLTTYASAEALFADIGIESRTGSHSDLFS